MQSRLQAKQEIGGNVSLRYSGSVFNAFLNSFHSSLVSVIMRTKSKYVDGTGTTDAIIKMIRYEGLSSFYKGMSTKIVQSVFAASVLFMVKEEILKAYILTAYKFKQILSTTTSLVKRSQNAS